MLNHRGFSAWITVDEEPLPEYLAAVDDGAHRVSCWIPGEEGQTFQVWWQDHGGKVDTCSFIVLDGLAVPGRFLCGEGIAMRAGIRASHMTEKPFVFTTVPERRDGEEPNTDAGTILLKIKRVKRVAAQRCNPVHEVGDIAASGKKKVGDLCIGFGEERATTLQHTTTWSVEPYDDPDSDKPSTYVSFVFRYRSAEFLESQGIATEVKKRIAPKVGDKRRVASLAVSETGPLATPSPSPPKKPRLSGPGLPSIDARPAPPSRAPSKTHAATPRRPSSNSRKPPAARRAASGRDIIKEAAQSPATFHPPPTLNYLAYLPLSPQATSNPPLPPFSNSQTTDTSQYSGSSTLSTLSNPSFSDYEDDDYHDFF